MGGGKADQVALSPGRSKTKPRKIAGFQVDGRGRIRTFEGISHQIYSLTRLATSVHARIVGRGILGRSPNVSMAKRALRSRSLVVACCKPDCDRKGGRSRRLRGTRREGRR